MADISCNSCGHFESHEPRRASAKAAGEKGAR